MPMMNELRRRVALFCVRLSGLLFPAAAASRVFSEGIGDDAVLCGVAAGAQVLCSGGLYSGNGSLRMGEADE